MCYLFTSGLLPSHFCVDLHATWRNTKKSCISEYCLSTLLMPSSKILKYCFSFQIKPNPSMEFRKILSKHIIWEVFDPDNIKWHNFRPFKVPKIRLDLRQKFVFKNLGWSTGLVRGLGPQRAGLHGLGPQRWSMDRGFMFFIRPSMTKG